jgi:dienelactone hydrolase
MPCNLAFLGMGKAADIMEEYSYENWYLSGHSLGGAMAASYLTKNGDAFDGLVLLAAYSTAELPEHLSVLSVYGSEDKVVNMESVERGRAFMPADYTEVCIEGGNHAWFAYYGEQEGDGTANISKEDQQQKTVEVIVNMIKGKK